MRDKTFVFHDDAFFELDPLEIPSDTRTLLPLDPRLVPVRKVPAAGLNIITDPTELALAWYAVAHFATSFEDLSHALSNALRCEDQERRLGRAMLMQTRNKLQEARDTATRRMMALLHEGAVPRPKEYAPTVCRHCSMSCSGDSYMVHNHIWNEAWPTRKGLLHLRCLEVRLGRKLKLEDFTDAPINDPIRFGYLMRSKESGADGQ